MYVPERYLDLRVAGHPLDFGRASQPEAWSGAALSPIYPLPGFFPILSLFQVGNGDLTGFYWPVGREDREPILCDTYHDDWTLEPLASSLEGLIKLKTAEGYAEPEDDEDGDYEAVREIAEQLGFSLPTPVAEEASPQLQLSLDPASPVALKKAAAGASRAGDLEGAAGLLEHCLQVLPEYTEALLMLGSVYRRQGKLVEAAKKLIEGLGAPVCFGGDRQKALQSVKRLRNEDYPELQDDPLWAQRQRLTFVTGVKKNDDFLVYEEAIATYLSQGKGILAVRLRMLIGELMWSETVSFRERYDYTDERHRQLLGEEIKKAGLAARLIAIGVPDVSGHARRAS